jgi:hypothetical protein
MIAALGLYESASFLRLGLPTIDGKNVPIDIRSQRVTEIRYIHSVILRLLVFEPSSVLLSDLWLLSTSTSHRPF